MESANGPLVSVVTVCFNSETHIAEAMESVLAQSYPAIEYIVVDGGSTDGTMDVVRSFGERFGDRLKWVSEPDQGIYDAMNKGIALCTGELIGLLNSDDAYVPDAVERIVDAYRAQPDAGAIFGDVEVIAEDGTPLRIELATMPEPGSRPPRMPMCHQSLFVARRVYAELGGFDTAYRILADYEQVLRMLRARVLFVHAPGVVARFREGGACSGDTARSNAERERIRVAYGANPLIERARRVRHAVNRFVYALVRRPTSPSHGADPSGVSDS